MKHQKIYMQAWLDAHGRAKVVNTDKWYLDFANQLLPLVAESYIYGGKDMEEDQKQVALTCALYLEDCVASGKLRTLPAFLHVDGRISAGRNQP